MTVIAWDGRTLAADRLADYGGTPLRTRKIAKVKTREGREYLAGHAGHWNCANAWIEWLSGKRTDPPSIPPNEAFTGILIDRAGRIWQVEAPLLAQVRAVPASGRFHAIGSGRGEALGAMAMGANARRAVQIANRFNVGCGLGVDVLTWG